MNLYTDSIVALNLYTGQMVWYYQTTHHDLWDADLPNNGVMFTGEVQDQGQDDVASGRRLRQQVRDDVHPRPADRQAAAADPRGQGAAEHRAGREHVADPADPAGGQRARQQAGQGPAALHGRQPHADERVRAVRDGDRAGRQAVQDRLRLRPVRHDAVRRAAVRDDGLAGELVQPGEPDLHHLRRDRPGDVVRADPGGLAGRRAPSAASAPDASASATRPRPTGATSPR